MSRATRLASPYGQPIKDVSKSRMVQRLNGLHSPYHLYEPCGHSHALNDPDAVEIEEIGMVCADGIIDTICNHCCTDEYGQTEVCADKHRHLPGISLCPTMAIVEGRDAPWAP